MSNKIAFTTPKYITSLILPKCSLVYGQVLASVYLHIALHINHQSKKPEPFREGCWRFQKTIAENIGYQPRVIGTALKKLVDLELLSVHYSNNLTIYKLKNHTFTDKNIEEFFEFNNNIEAKLLQGLNNTETETFTKLFRELEAINLIDDPIQLSFLLKNIWFDDISLLRNWISKSETIYKGSSLFFINNVALQLFDYIKDSSKERNRELDAITNINRALISGTSPSTISRYVNAFVEADCLTLEEYHSNISQKLCLNKKFLNDEKNISVVDEEMKNKISCPICDNEFKSYKDVCVHISKSEDAQHKLLRYLKDQKKCKTYNDLLEVYANNESEIEEVKSNPKEEKPYLQIPTNCGSSISCKACHIKNKKDSIWINCTEQRKTAYLKEYNIVEDAVVEDKPKPMVRTASLAKAVEVVKNEVKKVEEIKNDKEEDWFAVVKETKKPRKTNPDSATGLVNYFYKAIGKKCPNYQRETSIVKNLLKENTPDDIRFTMDFLADVKKADHLGLLRYCFEEAKEYPRYISELDKEGTAAYLLNVYYKGTEKPINKDKFVFEVKKIEKLFDNYSYEQLYVAIQYMVSINCASINFIGSKVGEAISKMKQSAANKNNPCLYDRDDLHHIKFALRDGKKKIKDIEDKFREDAIKLAREMFKQGLYADKFSNIEWAWFIGLEFDIEMYNLSSDIKCPRLDEMINSPEVKPELKQRAMRAREAFYNWANEQMSKFEQKEVM